MHLDHVLASNATYSETSYQFHSILYDGLVNVTPEFEIDTQSDEDSKYICVKSPSITLKIPFLKRELVFPRID